MKNYLPTLDGWRAVAILMVLFNHSTAGLFFSGDQSSSLEVDQALGMPGPLLHALFAKLSSYGARGIHLFFAISGFLITIRLIRDEEERQGVNLVAFYVRRACRILPLYFLYLGTLAMLSLAGSLQVDPWEWLGCLLFFRNYLPGVPATDGWYTHHFWTLSLEEHFYCTWPFLFALIGRRHRAATAAACAIAVFSWRTFAESTNLVAEFGYWSQRSDTRSDGLFWGCFAAILLGSPAIEAVIHRRQSFSVWLGLVAVFVLSVAGGLPGGGFLFPFLIPWIIVGTIAHPEWRISRCLEWPAVRWIGRLSYSLYVWQQLFLIADIQDMRSDPFGGLQVLPGNLLATFVVATVSYYAVERPFVRWGQRWSQTWISRKTMRRGLATSESPLAAIP